VSAFIIAHILCDIRKPGCWSGEVGEPEIGEPGQTVGQLREILRRHAGWTYSAGKDRCSICNGNRVEA
jgi:hypothetical protein